ncbi:hypothetical protein BH11BAC2_BH11BAC2_22450 [soil metagenome]
MENVNDKAGSEYWTSFWSQLEIPEPINVSKKTISNYSVRKFHENYQEIFKDYSTSGKKLIELGCGNSVWLSYFHQQYGFDITGLDYSEYGCEQTRKILKRDKISGTIIQGDIFSPPIELIEQFDIVCSFGVVEHFDDTKAAILAMKKFVKPGGMIILTVPNLKSITGFLQKIMNKPVYDIHVAMDKNYLTDKITQSGFKVIKANYFIPISFGVTLEKHENQKVNYLGIKKVILKSFQVIEKIAWLIDDNVIKLPISTYFSSGIFTASILPVSEESK